MRKIFRLLTSFTFLLFGHITYAQNVGIGTNTPHSSARLEISSTSSGLLFPRLTGVQRDAIQNPVAGLAIFCTNCGDGEMQYYNGTSWRSMNMGAAANYPLISSLNCGSLNEYGFFTVGEIGRVLNVSIPYTGGNGGTYVAQTIKSTGVSGLTASLTAGTLANGAGTVTYTITGTPAVSGTASFALTIGGQSCTLNIFVANEVDPQFNPDLTYGTLSDIEGRTYKTIQIGSQIWMAENLRTTKYSDGDKIPIVGELEWRQNNENFSGLPMMKPVLDQLPFSAVYNWYAINPATNGNKNVCPSGWHIPSDAEWNVLIEFLDPSYQPLFNEPQSTIAGGKMKTILSGISTLGVYWLSPNQDATNSSGFSGLPGPYLDRFFEWPNRVDEGQWWSSTDNNFGLAWARSLRFSSGGIFRINYLMGEGLSVRCLKD